MNNSGVIFLSVGGLALIAFFAFRGNSRGRYGGQGQYGLIPRGRSAMRGDSLGGILTGVGNLGTGIGDVIGAFRDVTVENEDSAHSHESSNTSYRDERPNNSIGDYV